MGAKSYRVYKNMNFIHLLLSQFFTVIFQFITSNSLQNYQNFFSWRRNVIVISKRSKGLLTLCALFSLRQLGFFSRCKDLWHYVIKPMYKIAFVIFRHLIALSPRTWAYNTFSSSWSLWRNLVHHRTRVVCLFPRTLDDCFFVLFCFSFLFRFCFCFYFWIEPRRTLVHNSAHSEPGLNQCLLVVKARLKPAYN